MYKAFTSWTISKGDSDSKRCLIYTLSVGSNPRVRRGSAALLTQICILPTQCTSLFSYIPTVKLIISFLRCGVSAIETGTGFLNCVYECQYSAG